MEHLAIEPLRSEVKHCYLSGLATIANWAIKEYNLLFAYTWYFEYQLPNGLPLGERIFTIDEIKIEELLKEAYGINIINNKKADLEKLLEIIEKNQKNSFPVGVGIDPFYCPWIPVYKSDHGDHFIVVIGLEKSKKILYCVDSFFSKKTETITFDDFAAGYLQHKLIEQQVKKDSLNAFQVLEGVISNLFRKQKYCENSFDAIRQFARELSFYEDMKSEIGNAKFFDSVPLILNMTFMVNNRHNYIPFLDSLGLLSKSDDFKPYQEEFRILAEKWEINRHLMLKTFLLPSPKKVLNTIATTLCELADTEEELALRMKKFLLTN